MKWDHSLIDTLEWGNQISHKEDKIKIADLIASKVENGQVIGVGSGSTSYLALIRIAERIRTERLSILAIPTSLEIRMTCAQLGISSNRGQGGKYRTPWRWIHRQRFC